MEPNFVENNAKLAEAIGDRIKLAFEEEDKDIYVTRSVVITEYFSSGREYASVAYTSFGRDGSGLGRWEVIGLVRAAQLMMEHEYVQDE